MIPVTEVGISILLLKCVKSDYGAKVITSLTKGGPSCAGFRHLDHFAEEGPSQERFLEVGSFCARDGAPDHEAPMEGNVRVKVTLNDYLCRLAPPVALHNKPFKSV
jgi:hypothetical protein